jgi:hypothetical protein
MPWTRVFMIVTGGALAGMVMGGLFGLAAGSLAPTFFGHLIPWTDVEPRGFATVGAAVVGVILGGGLAIFALLIQLAITRRGRGPSETRRD